MRTHSAVPSSARQASTKPNGAAAPKHPAAIHAAPPSSPSNTTNRSASPPASPKMNQHQAPGSTPCGSRHPFAARGSARPCSGLASTTPVRTHCPRSASSFMTTTASRVGFTKPRALRPSSRPIAGSLRRSATSNCVCVSTRNVTPHAAPLNRRLRPEPPAPIRPPACAPRARSSPRRSPPRSSPSAAPSRSGPACPAAGSASPPRPE